MKTLAMICTFGVMLSVSAQAQYEHELIRRMTVFPISVPAALTAPAEDAWWTVREKLTESKRFLVASKAFMQQKDVFQPRGELTPADAIILGKLLDSHALIATYLKGKTLFMRVYDGDIGRVLWQHELELHPSIPVSQQIEAAAVKLIQDFIASLPYQGFVVKDDLKSDVVFVREGQRYFHAEIGVDSRVDVGDAAQIIRVRSNNLRPLFVDGSIIEVIAEGVVTEVNKGLLTVKMERAIRNIDLHDLVKLPNEYQRLQESYALKESISRQFAPEILSPQMYELEQEVRENKPLVTSLSMIANIAVFLLLAF